MFNPNSRYYNLPTTTMTVIGRNGEPVEIRYVRRRFIPSVEGETLIQEHAFTANGAARQHHRPLPRRSDPVLACVRYQRWF